MVKMAKQGRKGEGGNGQVKYHYYYKLQTLVICNHNAVPHYLYTVTIATTHAHLELENNQMDWN